MIKLFVGLLLCFTIGLNHLGFSQNTTYNIQDYTPAILLNKGQVQYKLFNNLYTQTESFDLAGMRVKNSARATYYTMINELLIGVGTRINFGLDIWVKSVRVDQVNSSPLSVFKLGGGHFARTALTGIGPKIKIAPFKKLKTFSIQSTLLFPITVDMEGTLGNAPFLSNDSYIWINQFYFDKAINSKFRFFLQFAPWLYVNRDLQMSGTFLATPVTGFFSYFPTQWLTIYLQTEWWPVWGNEILNSYFLQLGPGIKLQLVKGLLEAEFLYTNFAIGKNSGAGQTFNVGIRLIGG